MSTTVTGCSSPPSRSGAGLKGKVAAAAANGIPQVLSPLAAEATGLRHGQEILIAHSPEEWLQAVLLRCGDDDQWQQLSAASHRYALNTWSRSRGLVLMRQGSGAPGPAHPGNLQLPRARLVTEMPTGQIFTARTNLPEPLFGVPETPVVEVAHQRPWLTLSETNRLIRQQGMATALARAWVLDELVRAIPLDAKQERRLIRTWLEEKEGVKSEEEIKTWLQHQGLHHTDLTVLATQQERLRRFRQFRWSDQVEQQFPRRKPELDQAVYSLLRVSKRAVAEEYHQRIASGEADFAELASSHAEGRERLSRGVIGPLPIAAAHPKSLAGCGSESPGSSGRRSRRARCGWWCGSRSRCLRA